MLDERAKGFALGAADYLLKPVSREDLLAALARVRVAPAPLGATAGFGGAAMSDGTRILVVEDNELNLKLVRDVLTYAGYEVMEARTGEQGVALAAECSPDLVLMDLQLPGIDGIEALQQLRASPSTQDVPVVAVTAFAMREDRERAFRSGFDGYVEKPYQRPGAAGAGPQLPAGGGAVSDETTILVVDDQPPNVRLLDAVLSPRGLSGAVGRIGRGRAGAAPRGTSPTSSSSTS